MLGGRAVVVGAVERGERRVRVERGADPAEGVGVHPHVGVDEHQHVAAWPGRRRRCGRRRRPSAGSVDDDHLVGGLARRGDGGHGLGEGGGLIGRWDDHGKLDIDAAIRSAA